MTTTVVRDQKVYFDKYDMTGTVNSLAVSYQVDMNDGTVLGNDTHINKPGLKMVSSSLQGLFDTTAIDAALFSAIAGTAKPMSYSNTGTGGALAYFYKANASKYTPEGKIGDLLKYSLDTTANGSLIRGTLMENQTAFAATAHGTARQIGAVTSAQSMYAALHVLNVSGTLPTMDLVIASNSTNSFAGAETSRITFAQVTDVGSQMLSVTGAITDTWWCPEFTIGGTLPSFDFVLVMGVL